MRKVEKDKMDWDKKNGGNEENRKGEKKGGEGELESEKL